jgi:hypothetical protein
VLGFPHCSQETPHMGQRGGREMKTANPSSITLKPINFCLIFLTQEQLGISCYLLKLVLIFQLWPKRGFKHLEPQKYFHNILPNNFLSFFFLEMSFCGFISTFLHTQTVKHTLKLFNKFSYYSYIIIIM